MFPGPVKERKDEIHDKNKGKHQAEKGRLNRQMRREIPSKVGKIWRKEGKQKGGTERRSRHKRRKVSQLVFLPEYKNKRKGRMVLV